MKKAVPLQPRIISGKNIHCHTPYQKNLKEEKQMNFTGLIIAVATFIIIGAFHPIVIKAEYYFGTRCWLVFALLGIALIAASLFVADSILSPVLGVAGCSSLWSILEIYEQRERVRKGWFPMNPKRKDEYTPDASEKE